MNVDVLLVAGARPNFVRLAPCIARSLDKVNYRGLRIRFRIAPFCG
jgi:hypothetical protein